LKFPRFMSGLYLEGVACMTYQCGKLHCHVPLHGIVIL
jgi:hypothetical protein